nr:pantetheine-phosphate adenylyltransferase [bacterium]
MRICVCPGSFDPITNGHLDIIRRAASLFDKVIVAVLRNSAKSPSFTEAQRVDMILTACAEAGLTVEVDVFEGLLVEYARKVGACAIVRGLRAVSDFEYEMQMASLNNLLCSDVQTVFFMTSAQYAYISSSMVREIGRLGGDISALVPPSIQEQVLCTLTSKP